MRLFISVKPNSRREGVQEIDRTHLVVSVAAPAREGKANDAAIKALARHFGIGPSAIKIVSGHKSKQKIVEM